MFTHVYTLPLIDQIYALRFFYVVIRCVARATYVHDGCCQPHCSCSLLPNNFSHLHCNIPPSCGDGVQNKLELMSYPLFSVERRRYETMRAYCKYTNFKILRHNSQ